MPKHSPMNGNLGIHSSCSSFLELLSLSLLCTHTAIMRPISTFSVWTLQRRYQSSMSSPQTTSVAGRRLMKFAFIGLGQMVSRQPASFIAGETKIGLFY